MRLPPYLKARFLTVGLVIGALWGLLSMVIFVAVGMFGPTSHPYHWLFQIFQNSVDTFWFRMVFLPFMLSLEAGFMFAFFGSTPVGATIGALIGTVASLLSYITRHSQESLNVEESKKTNSE